MGRGRKGIQVHNLQKEKCTNPSESSRDASPVDEKETEEAALDLSLRPASNFSGHGSIHESEKDDETEPFWTTSNFIGIHFYF